jgi:tetratricopeptide (TPR) repeat protein
MSPAAAHDRSAKVGDAAKPSHVEAPSRSFVVEPIVIFRLLIDCRPSRVFSRVERERNADRRPGESDKCDGIFMDPLIAAAGRALAAGDALTALKRIALRDDAPALALRGIAMAQLGDFRRATELLHRAARAFGPKQPVARARCVVARAEIALVCRDLSGPMEGLGAARATLEAMGDRANAAHAGYLDARRLLLIGRLDEAERTLEALAFDVAPKASQTGYFLVLAGIAMRRVRAHPARAALERAEHAAREAGIPALLAEVAAVARALAAPAARLLAGGKIALVGLAEVEALTDSGALVIDACRHVVRVGTIVISLAGRPVLFALARALAEASPEDASREILMARAFRAREADESHRARLRVEIGRLRRAMASVAAVQATKRGFTLKPNQGQTVVVLAPPIEEAHAEVLALLADGEAWSSSALALALDVSPRSVQRALEALAADGKAETFGRGRACRWIAPPSPGFPTGLLLPAAITSG